MKRGGGGRGGCAHPVAELLGHGGVLNSLVAGGPGGGHVAHLRGGEGVGSG